MSIFTTPLQFGYFTALLYAVLFWFRGYKEERLSDTLMGFIMFFLAMEIQDYTFGFAGINILWEELNGFPRYFHLAFAPTIYFYMRALTQRDFRFHKRHWLHYIPYTIYFLFNFLIFLMGKSAVTSIEKFRYEWNLYGLEYILVYISYTYYFVLSLRQFRTYRSWIENYFSDIEAINLSWLRNFIYLIIAGEVFRLIWHLIDVIFDDLPFEQDWWWHLFTVLIILYVSIKAYRQHSQYGPHYFHQEESSIQDSDPLTTDTEPQLQITDLDWQPLRDPLLRLFTEEKIYLNPNLSLGDLALRLKSNTSVLSALINQGFDKNFNDFVNEYRIEEFLRNSKNPANNHLTLLAIALDSGFNSKSTFNRAFKKAKGVSPREYLG